MPAAVVIAILLALAYLSGSIPFGWLVARARGVDIQTVGSGNIGAANVTRTLGKRLGAVVLVADALKGALPVLVCMRLPIDAGEWLAGTLGLAATVGHCFPVWLGFRGGKGVATALGVLCVLDPLALGVGLGAFLLVYAAKRYVSLASLIAAMAVLAAEVVLGRPRVTIGLTALLVVLIVARHRENLERLVGGRERRV